jgi:D-alanyl-D-alanine carboxypeptidase (penicillin-binding protein 5/6)
VNHEGDSVKKIIFLGLLLFGTSFSPAFAAILGIKADSAILMNANTGEIIYYKNAYKAMKPASTTKIMTTILALEKSSLDRMVTVSRDAASRCGTSLSLRPNERISMRYLLYGVMLSSGNDAAAATAHAISGSEASFSRLMTAKAKKIGMRNTQYKNASGLPATGHYTTAYDMALLTRYALKNGHFAKIVSTKTKTITSYRSGKARTRTIRNHNKMLWKYPATVGVKTGYTIAAGGCLVSAAQKNGVTLIAVVLKTHFIYSDSIKLFDYGFSKIRKRK